MRLDVGMIRAEQLLRSIYGKLLDLIGELLASIIAAARVAFGIFVREDTSKSSEHVVRHVILTWNQFDYVMLSLCFRSNQFGNSGISHCTHSSHYNIQQR